MVRPCQARIVLLSSFWNVASHDGMGALISSWASCPTASKCFLSESLEQQLVKVHKWWSYSTWGWKWKNMKEHLANICKYIQKFSGRSKMNRDHLRICWWGLWCLMSFLVFAICCKPSFCPSMWHGISKHWDGHGHKKGTEKAQAAHQPRVTHQWPVQKITGPPWSTCTVVVLRIFFVGQDFFSTAELPFFQLCTWFSGFLFFSARLKLKTGWLAASCPGNTGWTFWSRVGGSLAPIGAGSLTPIGVGGVGGMGRMGTYMFKYEIDLRPNSTETSQLSSLLYPSLLYCNSSLLYCSWMYSSLLYFFSTLITLLYSTLFSLLFLFCLLCIVKSP